MRTPLRGLFLLLLFLSLPSAYALDLGNGQDKECDWNSISIDARLWQCETLKITGTISVPTGSGILDIRVRQWAEIDGIINLSGTGAAPRYGGFAGGQGAEDENGGDGQGPTGAVGRGGQKSDGTFSSCAGAGGSGGLHSGLNSPTKGDDTGILAGDCSPGTALGGAAPTTTYSDPTNLENQIFGGSGGGAGGSADDGAGFNAGGNGGDGGGVIRILAGGDIDILAGTTLSVNGDNGQDGIVDGGGGDGNSGAGGGGAGGTIYIASLSDILISGTPTLNAVGGLGGTATAPAGNGSDGDAGIIRLEDGDGFISGASTIGNPSGSLSTGVAPTPLSQVLLESDISPGCALRSTLPSNFMNLSVLLGLGLVWIVLIQLTRSFKIDHTSL